MSGIGGRVRELDELLVAMFEAQKDLKKNRDESRVAREEKEERKEQIGRALAAKTLARKRSVMASGSSNDNRDSGEVGLMRGEGRGKRRRLEEEGVSGLFGLGESLKESDMARVAVERERLALDRKRIEIERLGRAEEREMRREERAAHDKLELEKFRLMRETFRGK